MEAGVEKAALVTGGSSGIGLAIARALREDGYALTLAARTREKVEAAAVELGAFAVPADVLEEKDCQRLVAAHAEQHGRLDVLVNSAGIGIAGTLEETTAKQWDLQHGVNLRGLFLVTRAALPLLKETHGHVINLASIAGTLPAPGLGAYGAAKAAVIALTRTLNAEYEADGIRATALCPAFVDTPMASWTGIAGDRMIQPEDCAELVRALLRLSPSARVPQIVVERLGADHLA
jgi:NAD(P)-dependent dehydrogenase (short-subunit alcohol dehydrogenase family)